MPEPHAYFMRHFKTMSQRQEMDAPRQEGSEILLIDEDRDEVFIPFPLKMKKRTSCPSGSTEGKPGERSSEKQGRKEGGLGEAGDQVGCS